MDFGFAVLPDISRELSEKAEREREREKIRNGSGINDIADDIFNKLLISVLVAIPIQILLVVECESLLLTASHSLSLSPFLFKTVLILLTDAVSYTLCEL